jgi:FKBP-type peptidyl-prolyl cis-trans isomerase FkpA
MKVTKQFLGATILALTTLAACKNTDFKKTKDGLPYRVMGEGKGDKIVPGNVIRFHATTRLGDSLLSTTYNQGEPQTVPIPKDGPNMAMFQIFLDAHKGDSILLLQPVDSILAKNPMAAKDSFLLSKKGKNIETVLKIVDVFKDQETVSSQQRATDSTAIQSYLKQKNITAAPTAKGVYIQTLAPGNGQLPKPGQTMTIRYTGRLFNGEEFDSNTKPGDQPMPVQIGSGSMIPGFEEGLSQLSKGEKAVLYVPSTMGYGERGSQPDMRTGQQRIKPNQNLIFEIEVVDITNAQQTPPPMGRPDSTKK